MAKNLPYLSSPGTIQKTFDKIKSVPTPERVTRDFVKTKLQIKGGPGDAMASFLKKIGFVNADGSPSDLYVKFRNSATSERAVAEAIKIAFAPLYEHNEYMHDLSDKEIKGLIIQVTGCAEDSRMLALTLSTLKGLKKYANFSYLFEKSDPELAQEPKVENELVTQLTSAQSYEQGVDLNLSYTINLNLPATSDIAVFDAIFKSLRENLLKK